MNSQEDIMIKSFGVVGAGTMGNGIAQVAARSGLNVVMCDVADEYLGRGLKSIDKSLQRDVDKGRLAAEEKEEILGRIKATKNLDELRETDLVVEAVTEDYAAKAAL